MKSASKKFIYTIIFTMIAGFSLLGCNAKLNKTQDKKETEIKILCTIFPEYDWVKNLTKNVTGVKVECLIKNGTDLHSYQPSAKDFIDINTSDLFIYVGGESDAWVNNLISKNPNIKGMSLLEILKDDIREEELIEGMQEEECENEDEGEDEIEYDEHVWLSLPLAAKICNAITQTLCELDSQNSSLYKLNCNEYLEKLLELHMEYEYALSEADKNTLLFCDRFPFRYLSDDYGLKYYAAFPGCSAETAASFDTMSFLTEKLKENNLSCVMILEHSSKKIAETVINNSGLKDVSILEINSLQSVTETEYNNGVTYLSLMKANLDVLKKALN